jgi:uncharacterized protein with FMN-binding domain
MIPKRALGALVTTVLALALLLSFRTPDAPTLEASTGSESAVVGQPSATASAAPETTTGTTTDTTTDTTGAGTTGSTATSTPAPSQDTASATTAYADGTVTGDVISTRYGDVQVQVTISGGAVTDVTALALPSRDGRSVRISQAAEPILREEALTAQDANIDLLSGATYTSGAYEESLQSALDQAAA